MLLLGTPNQACQEREASSSGHRFSHPCAISSRCECIADLHGELDIVEGNGMERLVFSDLYPGLRGDGSYRRDLDKRRSDTQRTFRGQPYLVDLRGFFRSTWFSRCTRFQVRYSFEDRLYGLLDEHTCLLLHCKSLWWGLPSPAVGLLATHVMNDRLRVSERAGFSLLSLLIVSFLHVGEVLHDGKESQEGGLLQGCFER